MSAALYCRRCGRELGTGLPSPCPACGRENGSQGRTGASSEESVAAARELLLDSIGRVSESFGKVGGPGIGWYSPGATCDARNPHRRAAARRRDLLDALSGAPGASPWDDLDSEARESWS